jgi:hypothetical protein
VTYADSGVALSGDQQTIQAGIWSVQKHIQSLTDELKLSRKIFEGNTLTWAAMSRMSPIMTSGIWATTSCWRWSRRRACSMPR